MNFEWYPDLWHDHKWGSRYFRREKFSKRTKILPWSLILQSQQHNIFEEKITDFTDTVIIIDITIVTVIVEGCVARRLYSRVNNYSYLCNASKMNNIGQNSLLLLVDKFLRKKKNISHGRWNFYTFLNAS